MDGGRRPFRIVPGLQTSRGDHVLKTLHKLWTKISQLEQTRRSESSGIQIGEDDDEGGEDAKESLNDVQLKLLKLQLKYIQKLLHERNAVEASEDAKPSGAASLTSSSSSKETQDDDLDMVPVKLEKETQTSKTSGCVDLVDNGQTVKDSVTATGDRRKSSHVKLSSASGEVKTCNDRSEASTTVKSLSKTQKTLPRGRLKTCMHSHYHLKLSDVPFIVGQLIAQQSSAVFDNLNARLTEDMQIKFGCSAGISHSVTANVQSIIGMMKMHNPALCMPPSAPEESQPCWISEESSKNSSDLRNMKKKLKKLARELSSLTVKQEELKTKLTGPECTKEKDEMYKEYSSISKLMETKAREIVEFHRDLKKESAKCSPARARTEVAHTPGASKTAGCEEPHGKNIKVGKATTLRMKRARTVHEQLQVTDIVWT